MTIKALPPSSQPSQDVMDEGPQGSEQPQPDLYRASVFAIGLLAETAKLGAPNCTCTSFSDFFGSKYPCLEKSGVVPQAEDGERAVVPSNPNFVAPLIPAFNYSVAPENEFFFIFK